MAILAFTSEESLIVTNLLLGAAVACAIVFSACAAVRHFIAIRRKRARAMREADSELSAMLREAGTRISR